MKLDLCSILNQNLLKMNISLKLITILCISFLISCDSNKGTKENNEDYSDRTIEVETSAEEDLDEGEDYLVSAHINSQLQVALGSVAGEKSSSPQLQEFAQRLAQGNKVIQKNISTLASAAGIEIDAALTPEYSRLLDSLQSYSGEKFDSAFLDLVIEEHDEDIQRFSTLSQKAKSPITRDLLTDNLEILRNQKNQAEELKNAMDN